jgi:hypothetical protein
MKPGFRIWIPIDQFELLDPDRDQGGPKKVKKFHVSSAGCSLLGVEDFSCILGVLYGGLGTIKLHFLI